MIRWSIRVSDNLLLQKGRLRTALLFCLAICLVATGVTAQDHQTMKKVLSRHLEEVFDVTKSNWKVRDGQYAVVDDDGHEVVRGTYAAGVRTGVWTFLNEAGTVVQRWDFSHDSLLYNSADSNSLFRTDYRLLGNVGDSGKFALPYKIGGSEYGFWLLYDERDIPAVVKGSSSVAQMTYVLTISEKGVLEGYTILFRGTGFADITIHRSVRGLRPEACEFVAASRDGRPIRSQMSWIVPLDINHFDHPGSNDYQTRKMSKY